MATMAVQRKGTQAMDGAEQQAVASAAGGAAETGAARVRRVFLDPLAELGLVRPKGMSAGAFDGALAGFVRNLAYMSADGLDILRVTVAGNLGGRHGSEWPAPALVYRWAANIEKNPELPEIAVSFLHSRLGEAALQQGFAVELLEFLEKYTSPPGDRVLADLRREGEANGRQLLRVADDMAAGRVTEQSRRWHGWYQDRLELARRLVEEGRAKRAAKLAGGA